MTPAMLLNWSIALAPVLVLLVLFEWLDVFHLMSPADLGKLLLLGALAGLSAYPISGRLLDTLPIGFSSYSRYVAPWSEEALKAAAIVWLFVRNRVGFKLDAVISGFAIGAGFSVVENIFYLLRFTDLGTGVWVVRGLGTAVMHGASGALFAGVSHQFNERTQRQPAVRWRLAPRRYVPGYLLAVALHLLFNQFPDQPELAMMTTLLAVPLLVLLVFRFGTREAEDWLDIDVGAHRHALDAWRSGGFPDGESGRLIAALAAQLNGRASAETLRAYCEVHTERVLRAEEVMRGEADGNGAFDPTAECAAFDRLRALGAALGRTTCAMLGPVLPFSRNDLWEMREFEAQVRRAGAHDTHRHG